MHDSPKAKTLISRRQLLKYLAAIAGWAGLHKFAGPGKIAAQEADAYKIYLPIFHRERGRSMATPILKLRGFNATQISMRTDSWDQGEFNYPNNLEVVKNDGDPQTYEEWCASLESAGVNLIRMHLGGRNRSIVVGAASLEPPPHGTYNIWHSALDPSDLPTYRSDQVTHPVNPTTWVNSNLGQLCVAAENHGVKFLVMPFWNREFRSDWINHAWNSGNRYIDGNNCEAVDQGWLVNARDIFTDAAAIAAAKARLQFIIDVLAPYNVIGCWEVCAELTWICTDYDFWGEPGWNAAMISNIRDDMVPWVSEMAQYIKDNDGSGAPVSGGQVRTRTNEQPWDPDPDHQMNVINEIHFVDELDFASSNWYLNGNPDRAIAKLRLCQELGITYIGQYWPFAHPSDPPGEADEDSPFLVSLLHEWISVCGAPGLNGPLRWPGIEEEGVNVWATGGYADPDLHSIAGVSEEFCSYVGPDYCSGANEDFESFVVSAGLTRHVAWGDAQFVLMMLDWPSGGVKTITVSNLTNGSHTLYVFDWVTGDLDSTQNLTAAGGSLTFNHTAGFTDNVLVALLEYDTGEASLYAPTLNVVCATGGRILRPLTAPEIVDRETIAAGDA